MPRPKPESVEWRQQLAALTRKIEQDPQNPGSFLERGHFFLQHHQTSPAIDDYSMAIRLDPEYFEAYNSRGVAYGEQGCFEQARQDLDQAIALSPFTPIVYVNRGVVRCHNREFQQSMADHNHAIALWMDHGVYPQQLQRWRAYHNRGLIHILLNRLPDSLPDMVRALVLAPGERTLHADVAKIYHQCSQRVLERFFAHSRSEHAREVILQHRLYGRGAQARADQVNLFRNLERLYSPTPFSTLVTSFKTFAQQLPKAE